MPASNLSQQDFSKGLNVVTAPHLVGNQQITRARNLLLDRHGALATRDGYSVLATSPIASATSPVRWIGVLNKNDLSAVHYAIQYNSTTSPTVNTLYLTGTSPWTSVGNFTTTYEIPQAVSALERELIAAGYETPKVFNGSTLTSVGSETIPSGPTIPTTIPVGAKHIAFHLSSIFLWNTSASTTSSAGPSALQQSWPNNYNQWPSAFITFVGKDDGQQGTGLATFTLAETGISPTQTLVLFKNYSTYQMTGLFGYTNPADLSTLIVPSIQRVKTDMGCVSPRSIQFISGLGVMRLTHKGVALFDGVEDKLVSEEIRPYLFGDEEQAISPINWQGAELAYAVQCTDPPLYILMLPVGGTSLTRILVHDLVRRAWTTADFPVGFQCANLILTQANLPTIRASTVENPAKIVRVFGGDATDNGAAISWSMRTRRYFLGSLSRPTYWRRALLDMTGQHGQSVTITASLIGLPNQVAGSRTMSGLATGSVWGTAVWGTFVWGATSTIADRVDFDIMRTAPQMYLDISGTGNVTIRGLDIQAKPKPLTRAAL